MIALPIVTAALAGVGVVAITSGAVFTGSASIGANTFTSGTVALSATETGGLNLDMAGMAPGDTRYGEVTVTNTGSLALRYAVSQAVTTNTNSLAENLDFDVKVGATCDAGNFNGTGTQLNGVSDTFATTAVFGSATTGAQAGDRSLAAAGTEKLCFRVQLPLAAPNSVQGSSATSTLTFAAEQTKNN